MRISLAWLKEWLEVPWDTQTLAHRLSMAGLEVDAVEPAALPFESVVVAEVLSVKPHTNSNKLNLCQVSVGDSAEPLHIVCGAPNVRAGIRVPLARVGAKLPSGMQIKESEIRGERSQGMLCGADELGLADAADGLFLLPPLAPLGEPLWSLFALDDHIIEVDLTPNRADCLSIMGIAREVGALVEAAWEPPFKLISSDSTGNQSINSPSVSLQADKACTVYCGRVIKGINNQADVPIWLSERLRRAGIRSLNPVVDVTNYVMLELGQPMHGFDLDALQGDVSVRFAKDAESLELLDGRDVSLNSDDLVIADDRGAIALAGVMGGSSTRVLETTQDIFLEAAHFAPEILAGKARRFGLHTESSHRFERGVSPDIQALAINRATDLLLEIVGGEAGNLVECDLNPHKSFELPEIKLHKAHVNNLLGENTLPGLLSVDRLTSILESLGMQVKTDPINGQGDLVWRVTPPLFRFDIKLEVDLIEEIARVFGYEVLAQDLPSLPKGVDTQAASANTRINTKQIKQTLVAYGYSEVITYSFVDEGALEKLGHTNPLILKNPISADLKAMRTTLALGLINTMTYNQARQKDRFQLFEAGLRFEQDSGELRQIPTLAGLLAGKKSNAFWLQTSSGTVSQSFDFFDLKGHVQALLKLSGQMETAVRFEPTQDVPMLHPGQGCDLFSGDQYLGYMGALHPSLCKAFDLIEPVLLFELDLARLWKGQSPSYQAVSRYPSVTRDLAFLVAESLEVDRLVRCIASEGPDCLDGVSLFDVYQGQGIEKDQKSVAFTLTFRHPSRTLKEAEVSDWVSGIVDAVCAQFGAKLRG